ncbi:MAG: GH3 auxin-responsive promoter family protein [Cytophagales bacterium]|nr:GH3 auxin-responsive promoter family protein [Cytophagales bacterium]MDW8383683.1 GH3 auxin-responsive promoter family protein [Flammeovirgaceae bacterium]
MGIRSFFAKPFAAYLHNQTLDWALRPMQTQTNVFRQLIRQARKTDFGREHGFEHIQTIADFQKQVPIRDYEALKPYLEKVIEGQRNVLWKGRPLYFAKTSGTTSGIKYIPISRQSMPYHIISARNALMSFVYETGKADFLDRKLIFLSGSPALDSKNGILTGRLSGIVNHHVPAWLRGNQLPSWQTNIIEDWEEKLDKIVEETLHQDMGLISGIPPWVQMYFDRIIAKTGKRIKEVFPNFSVFVYGGVNYEPYRARIEESIGQPISSIETYPASEGFIAYQNSQKESGLLLLLNHGIFYEFVPLEEYFQPNPRRFTIEEVELEKNYALIMSTNAGLWAYSIGDTVKFVAKNPYKLLVTGRVKHFISAFGEHVIGEEVEKAMCLALEKYPQVKIAEFTVAPMVTPSEGLPYHEWLIAFVNSPDSIDDFADEIDIQMRNLNIYYEDLRAGNILRRLVITSLLPDAFQQYMKSIGKLGGQNKVPRLANDRKIADALSLWRR